MFIRFTVTAIICEGGTDDRGVAERFKKKNKKWNKINIIANVEEKKSQWSNNNKLIIII